MNSGNGYDEYDELEDWDAWVDEAFEEYQDPGDPLFPPKSSSSSNLPAKIPGKKKVNLTKKHKWQIPIDWNYPIGDKAKKMRDELEKLKQERQLKRAEEAKKISWKEISRGDEYEVWVQGTCVGRVRQNLKGKWKMHPSFKWKQNAYNKHVIIEQDYYDFAEVGRAMVDLWVIS
tara:strand:+ start:178 stop:699 length:522 start_codon:yes stop_codon:yes gene_type:complete